MDSQICFINGLPSEILEVIFIHGARQHYDFAGGHPIPFAAHWVRVSYVSRHWRNVALNCPTLWSYLFLTSSRWTEELLARSQKAPLKLKVNLHRHNRLRVLPFLEQAIHHLERIQEIRLHVAFSNAQFLSKLYSPAPLLQVLAISTDCDPSEGFPAPFHGDTPTLRELEFIGCALPWYSLKLSGLASLSLTNIPVQFQQDTAVFLTTLSCIPDLTYLYLEDALASATDFLSSAAFYRFPKINLPHLSRFLIAAPLSTVIALLSCVNIPLETNLRLYPYSSVERNMSSLDDYAPLCSLVAQRFAMLEDQGPANSTIRSLVVGITERGEGKLTFSASERDCHYFNPVYSLEWGLNIPFQVLLPFSRSTSTSDRDRIINQFCCPIPLPNVQSLHFIDPPFSPVFWTHVLGRFQDLRYLKLSNGCMPGLASVLSSTSCDSTEEMVGDAVRGPNEILVPALGELKLCGIKFSTALERDIGPLEVADVQSLFDALATRVKPRGRLSVTRCTERNCDGEENELNLAGWWEGGRFHAVDEH